MPPIALQRERRQRIAARRAADREVDAIAVERAQHAEVLGDLERAVVGQHDAAAADADAREVAEAIAAMRTSGLAQASIGVPWCSATQYR